MKLTLPQNPYHKFVRLLKSFTMEAPRHSISELSKETGIPRTTVYRILTALTQGELLEKVYNSNKYKVGTELYFIGSLYLSTTDFIKIAEPVIKVLNDLTGEVTNISILDGSGNQIIVTKEESKHSLSLGTHIGFTSPAYAHAVGKALLSELTEVELDKLYPDEALKPLTKKTITTKTELKRELEQIRKTSVAFNRGEAFDGAEGVASPMRNASGQIIAAMTIAVPSVRLNDDKRERFATLIRLGAGLVNYKLGYQNTVKPVCNIEEIRDWWQKRL